MLQSAPSILHRPIAYSYMRLSSLRQLEGFGIERQDRRARRFAEKHDLDLRETTTLRDLGKSGFKGDNLKEGGALRAFLDAVKEGLVPRGSWLIIEALDRFSRQAPMKILPIFIEILESGIIIATLSDQKIHRWEEYHGDSLNLIGSILGFQRAYEESLRKQDFQVETWKKKRREAQEGKIVTGRVPQWLEIEVVEGQKRFKRRDDRVALVERIFNELAEGIGRGTIARRLNEAKIPAFTDKGDGWHGGTVQKLTTSRQVLGEYQPMKLVEVVDAHGVARIRREPSGDPITNYYPRIISDELWLKAQRASKARRSLEEGRVANVGGRMGKNYSNLFREVARCEVCASSMVYRDGSPRGRPFVQCSRFKRRMCDNGTKFFYDPLEAGVLEWVWQLDLTEHVPDAAKAIEAELGTLTLKREKTQAKIDRLLEEFAEGRSNSVAVLVRKFEDEIKTLDGAIAKLQEQLNDMQTQLDHTERQQAIQDLHQKLEKATDGAERFRIRAKVANAINTVIEKMIFTARGVINIKIRNTDYWYFVKDGELLTMLLGRQSMAEVVKRATFVEFGGERYPLKSAE
jgi:hypothetical protein